MSQNVVVGVDLGGTKILIMLADTKGQVLAQTKIPTQACQGQQYVLDQIVAAIWALLQKEGVKKDLVRCVGLGVPGSVDPQQGWLHFAPNLNWRNQPLAKILSTKLGLSIYMDNDANLAALGEYTYGTGCGAHHMIYITVSTGVGGGLILGGQIFHGATGEAGEIGHITVAENGPICRCGNRGCLEVMASGTALARQAKELVDQKLGQNILAVAGHRDNISATKVARAASLGDIEALTLFRQVGVYLGIALAGLINLINPQVIVMGGGMMKSSDLFWSTMLEQAKNSCFASSFNAVRIMPASLDDSSGARGAVALALANIN